MKFVVSVPYYSERCGGTSVLLELARRLYERGHDSKVFLHDRTNEHINPIYSVYTYDERVDDDTIVIYSEMDVGNRLHATRIVRLVLYGSHMYDRYDPNEIIYYHAPFCKNNRTDQLLTILRWPTGFENQHMIRTNRACYAVKKGVRIPEIRKLVNDTNTLKDKGINIEGKGHAELIKIFNTTKYFYCYDPCCFLIIMALMCGCVVVQCPIPGYTSEEWKYTINIMGLNGIAYGETDIERAEKTIDNAIDDCMKLKQFSETSVDKFVNSIATGTHNRVKCYKFNESIYSLQHIMK